MEQQFAYVVHPLTNGLTEVTNRAVLWGLKKHLEEAKRKWTEELPSVLLSYKTTPRKGMGGSLFHLCFGIEALVLVEIGSTS